MRRVAIPILMKGNIVLLDVSIISFMVLLAVRYDFVIPTTIPMALKPLRERRHDSVLFLATGKYSRFENVMSENYV
jgi:hypothetical protein